MLWSFTISYPYLYSILFNLTNLRFVGNNDFNTPTKPMPSMLKLCGLFYTCHLHQRPLKRVANV